MDRVYSFSQQTTLETQFVAIAIGESGPNQRHVGIVHRAENVPTAVLHLAGHLRLRNDLPSAKHFHLCVVTGLRPERQRSLAAQCRRIWKKNEAGGVPYGFSDPQSSFALQSGKFLASPTRYGLTCATFVLAVFDVVGLPLVQYEQWASGREGDSEWQEQIIQLLATNAEPKHIERLQKDIGCVRYRPEEVAAAGALVPPPASFPATEELSKSILQGIDNILRPPSTEASPS